jgi:predicted ATP-dependent endonuclease of OLD family
MPIKQIKIENFLYTKNTLQFDFCEGINIFIGGNGTGKTTLLKEIYSQNQQGTLFIPTAEMLSHSKGLLALEREYKLPFDKTQIDILVKAELPETKELKSNAVKVLDKISGVIDGEVVFENDTFYVKKNNGTLVEFNSEADGFRKFGLLWKLLRNGLVEKGTTLLWDEPESSINPELIPTLIEILLELQNGGVQIFIATHSYEVARWFELKSNSENVIKYFNMQKNNAVITVESAENYKDLENNPIEKAGNILFDAVVEKANGGQNE